MAMESVLKKTDQLSKAQQSGDVVQGEEGEVRHLNKVLLRPLVVHASAHYVPCEIQSRS